MAPGNFGQTTDKAFLGYFPAYMRIAAELGPRARVCEVGVFHGESLFLWQQLFPYGEVTGVDNDPGSIWPPGARVVLADALDPALPGKLGGPFDMIVDDGVHYGETAETTFGLLWPLVAPGGYYVVEDWYVGIPGDPVYPAYHRGSMVSFVQSLLPRMLASQDAEADEIAYRYGLAVIHRRAA